MLLCLPKTSLFPFSVHENRLWHSYSNYSVTVKGNEVRGYVDVILRPVSDFSAGLESRAFSVGLVCLLPSLTAF